MANVCLYLQMHQPFRIRRFGVLELGKGHDPVAHDLNRSILERVAERSYRPALERLARAIHRTEGDFRFSLGVSGCLLRQLQSWAPDVIQTMREMIATGCVEILAETDAHSLAFLFDNNEMQRQVQAHRTRVRALLHTESRVFRNTELIYGDAVGEFCADNGFVGCLVGERALAGRSPHHLYTSPGGVPLIPKSDQLSDDLAFRFGDPTWEHHPLLASEYAKWIHGTPGDFVGLFMDFETFGEHHSARSGILRFLEAFPRESLARGVGFWTPSELLEHCTSRGPVHVPGYTSWADEERDLTAWLGNAMQRDATQAVYELLSSGSRTELLQDLTTSDHVYYMSTKGRSDGEVHSYFSPFESAYDAYVAFMNTLQEARFAPNISRVRPRETQATQDIGSESDLFPTGRNPTLLE